MLVVDLFWDEKKATSVIVQHVHAREARPGGSSAAHHIGMSRKKKKKHTERWLALYFTSCRPIISESNFRILSFSPELKVSGCHEYIR